MTCRAPLLGQPRVPESSTARTTRYAEHRLAQSTPCAQVCRRELREVRCDCSLVLRKVLLALLRGGTEQRRPHLAAADDDTRSRSLIVDHHQGVVGGCAVEPAALHVRRHRRLRSEDDGEPRRHCHERDTTGDRCFPQYQGLRLAPWPARRPLPASYAAERHVGASCVQLLCMIWFRTHRISPNPKTIQLILLGASLFRDRQSPVHELSAGTYNVVRI